jgi:hypothetical protein
LRSTFELPELGDLAEGVERAQGGHDHTRFAVEKTAFEHKITKHRHGQDEKKLHEARSLTRAKHLFRGDGGVVVVLFDSVGDRLCRIVMNFSIESLYPPVDQNPLVNAMPRNAALVFQKQTVHERRPSVSETNARTAKVVDAPE